MAAFVKDGRMLHLREGVSVC